jgi:phage shock protein PspC (stress-responsive transcriptional regulator)
MQHHTPTMTSSTALMRPRDGRLLAGVCAGIADHYHWDRTTVRLAAVASCLLPGPQIVLYLAAWVLMPAAGRPRREVMPAA